MKSSSPVRGRITRVLGIMAVASLLSGLLPSFATAAEPAPPTSAEPVTTPTSPQETTKPPVAMSREDWQKAMTRVPLPKKGCFTSSYPSMEWQEVPCTTAPNRPYPPTRGRRPQTVGNGTDFAAEVTNLISSVTGSFDSVTGVTSESGNAGGLPPAVANTFSLQLNTKPFTTSVCSSAANPAACQGWQQFIYSNSGSAFIQYWLLRYNTTCPSGWNTFSFSGSTDIYCWRNGTNAASVPVQAIANLVDLSVTGTTNSGGTDTVIMTTAAGNLSAANQDSMLSLASGWQGAEFIIVGDCCGSEATFNAGSTIVVRTTVHHGTTNAPSCVLEGFTGETNNLILVGTPAVTTGPSPAIVSTQSNIAGTTASCASANGVGDTHLTTFGGLLYDFQASGDFILVQATPDFVVQTRQVSGAPTWPNASVNKAVATRMGKTKVAICLAPARLEIDGKTVKLRDGKSLSLPDGVDISRRGNVYIIADQSGDSVRAELNAGWINVIVGLGRWPAKVRGLLANANGNVNQIETRDGTVLTNPFSFEDLYHRYADSWRVPSNESLLSVCGITGRGIPKKPFYANDLNANAYKRARAVCEAAGVKVESLLDACTLDVAVIGSGTAARVFVGTPAPIAVAQPGSGR